MYSGSAICVQSFIELASMDPEIFFFFGGGGGGGPCWTFKQKKAWSE